jgi:hypothetical protein
MLTVGLIEASVLAERPILFFPAPMFEVSRFGLRWQLTLLSPTLIEAILEGHQPATLELEDLLKQFPMEWDQQFEMK